ncbi:hypothetical protein NP493_636g00002 [Ridgeia piscesae]|uniref:Cell growth-regulating nucleolar protein n=1 Tax=Ridgeia piscesae TaxID=27915 RepID=A0AAD9KT41_RIDPI|nr:hypothetical protein NP493_636g00002 [Ridgeia piscesae]
MVVFACGSCGDPVKKNQVEKHCQFKCKDCNILSCIDCGKDFWGDSYKEHTKCISEEEKYSGKDFKPRPGANKGEAKQEAWFNQVQQAIDAAHSSNHTLKELLERLKEFPNIPRKKAKFENFLKNSMRVRNAALVTQAWDAISISLTNGSAPQKKDANTGDSDNKNTDSASDKETVNGSIEKSDTKLSKRERKEERRRLAKKGEKKDKDKEETENESKKMKKMKKKRKHEDDEGKENEEEETDGNESKGKQKSKKGHTKEEPANKKQRTEDVTEEQEVAPPTEGTFKWESAIIGVLKRAPDNEISIKKLRKKVLCEYAARGGEGKDHLSEEKILAKFQKKISKNPRLKIHKEKVKLLK